MNFSDYPFNNHFLTLQCGRMHYLDEGQGKPILMLHGNPSWSYYYRHLVTQLKSSYRVIVPDHLGCGLSDKPGDADYSYTLAERISNIESLLKHLHLDTDITLVMHDWGGAIGMGLATRHPDWFSRFVLFNTAAFFPLPEALPWQLKLALSPLGRLLIRSMNGFAQAAAWVGCQQKPLTRTIRRSYCAPYNSWHNRIATLRFIQDIPRDPLHNSYALARDISQQLSQLSARDCLICWGGKDPVFTPAYFSRWQEIFPHAQTHYFKQAGHYVLEDASEVILPLVETFLAQTQ